jgi:hypothetical protein
MPALRLSPVSSMVYQEIRADTKEYALQLLQEGWELEIITTAIKVSS